MQALGSCTWGTCVNAGSESQFSYERAVLVLRYNGSIVPVTLVSLKSKEPCRDLSEDEATR